MVRITTGWEISPDGKKLKQKQKVLGYYRTRAEAIKALADYNYSPYDLNALTITLGECYQGAARDFPEQQIRRYSNAFKYLKPIADTPIRNIKAGQLQACVDSCQNTQQNVIKTVLHKIYQYALMNELVDKDPSRLIKTAAYHTTIDRQVFTTEQINELWSMTDEWWVKCVLMLLYSGMRTKELKMVELKNIDLQDGWIHLSTAKNETSIRKIPIHERTMPLFCDYVEQGGDLYGYSHAYLNDNLKSLQGHTAHDCRHTFTTRLRELGVDHLIIQRLLGHRPDSITERVYTHIKDDELKAAVSILIY